MSAERDETSDTSSSSTPPPFPAWLAKMFPRGMRRRMVNVGVRGGREDAGASGSGKLLMHVAEWGPSRGRPILMMHGNPSWCFLYRKVVAELLGGGSGAAGGDQKEDVDHRKDQHLRLIVPDLIGLGCSDKPRELTAHTLPAHSAWLGSLIDQLELEDIVFVGQDWGGPIGMHALSSRMERLKGMVILNTVLGPPREGFRPTGFHRFAQMPLISDLVFRITGFPQNVMLFAQGDRRSIMGRTALGYWWPLRHIRDRAAPMALARMVPDSMQHASIAPLRVCEEAARSFQGPTALVWGDKDPVLGRVFNHMQRLLPNPQVTRTNAGHFLQEEVPSEIAAAIRDVSRAGGQR